jgi:hypothetical protein
MMVFCIHGKSSHFGQDELGFEHCIKLLLITNPLAPPDSVIAMEMLMVYESTTKSSTHDPAIYLDRSKFELC